MERFERSLTGRNEAFHAGFLQELLAYLQITLGCCEVNVESWDVSANLQGSAPH